MNLPDMKGKLLAAGDRVRHSGGFEGVLFQRKDGYLGVKWDTPRDDSPDLQTDKSLEKIL